MNRILKDSKSFKNVFNLLTKSKINNYNCTTSGSIIFNKSNTTGINDNNNTIKNFTTTTNKTTITTIIDNNNINNKILNIIERTHSCGEITGKDIGKQVLIYGWISSLRNLGDKVFMVIRDGHGKVQCYIKLNGSATSNTCKLSSSVPLIDIDVNASIEENIKLFKLESIVGIVGNVVARPDGMKNDKMVTGEIEILVNEVKLLNNCVDLPFTIEHDSSKASEELRLKYRYVDLRRDQVQSNIRLRSRLAMATRNYLVGQHGFVEVETPTLFRPTPEGAREYLVPTRYKGQFYSLPQSPQQYKQLLMVGGMDRYFQLARCYRDEDLRSDRQPEFTQIDMELSFVNQSMIVRTIEGLIKKLWSEAGYTLNYDFPHMTYDQVLSRYGIDKPDTRYSMELQDITSIFKESSIGIFKSALSAQSNSFKESIPIIKCIKLDQVLPTLKNKEIEQIVNDSKLNGNNGVVSIQCQPGNNWKSLISKYLSPVEKEELINRLSIKDGDVIFISAGARCNVESTLGKVRIQSAQLLKEKGLLVLDPKQFNFLWVVDFPLFTPSDYLNDSSPLTSTHHPFTAPHPEDIELLINSNSTAGEYSKIRGQHYDIVLNGIELGGGSIRIHNSDVQLTVLEKVLQLPPHMVSRFNHLITALSMGCPPHGGIALGFDRLVSLLVPNATSIRDVIAFPKTSGGKELMTSSPSTVTSIELDELHLSLKD